MSPTDSPAVVLLSGGMDSSVLLYHVKKELRRSPLRAVSYDYGQRHARELDAARWQAETLEVEEHRIIDITFVKELVREGTSLVEGGADVPDLDSLSPNQLSQPPTYVPNRNMILLSVAVAYAEAQGVRDVYYGAQAQDEYGYWDCTAEFLERFNGVLALNRAEAVCVHAPFVGLKKWELVVKGGVLGVDFGHTWSCYRGGDRPCGTCPTCVERAKAFSEAGVCDPLLGG